MSYHPTAADKQTVKTMVACGIPQEDIARCLGIDGIDAKTLRKHYRDELDTSIAKANSVIASRLYAAAERGEPWAVCFWLKTRGHPDGKPIEQQLKIVVTGIRPTPENSE
jgi:hypothetical protein